jgi:hypothetical protein
MSLVVIADRAFPELFLPHGLTSFVNTTSMNIVLAKLQETVSWADDNETIMRRLLVACGMDSRKAHSLNNFRDGRSKRRTERRTKRTLRRP